MGQALGCMYCCDFESVELFQLLVDISSYVKKIGGLKYACRFFFHMPSFCMHEEWLIFSSLSSFVLPISAMSVAQNTCIACSLWHV